MQAYKLLIKRADGSLGPLFINRPQRIPLGKWLNAENHPTKGYAVRPGWHCAAAPVAPHLSTKGRVWCEGEIDDYEEFTRPTIQGSLWYIANRMRVLRELKNA